MANRDTRALVAHLFRRAGFGLRQDELDHFTQLGVQGSVDYLITYDQVTDPADTKFPLPDLTSYFPAYASKTGHTLAEQKAHGKLRAQAALLIQEWWVNRMLATARPLQEKMTLFWHGHFATALSKVRAGAMLEQNQLFRGMALGNFNTLLKAVNQDPAMLRWLDGAENRAGKPNENFSRELMELFTLGVGNFSETDVREGARALTGWFIRAYEFETGRTDLQAQLRARLHDGGSKTYLGHTGNLDSNDVMDILSAHPATGPFIANKLFTFFANGNPDQATLKPLVDTYYSSKYDIKAMVRQLLLSDAFYSDQSFQQHFKSPVEYAVGTVRELGLQVPAVRLISAMTLMGQELFNPPNVGGWHGDLGWSNEGTLVERFNFAGLLTAHHATRQADLTPSQSLGTQTQMGTQMTTAPTVSAALPDLDVQALVGQSGAHDPAGLVDYLLARFIGVGATPATRAALIAYLGPTLSPQVIESRGRGLLQLLLATPEYQLN